MSNGPIPQHVDPRRLADRGVVLDGAWPLSVFGRLCQPLTDNSGEVRAKLQFARNEQGAAVINASLDTEVRMVCQRCLEEVALPIHGDYSYVVVREGTEGASIPKGFDALEVGEEPLDILAIVEDELLLALPIVPVHETDVCQQPAGLEDPVPSEDEVSRSNPFSVLAQLKRDPNG